MKKMKTPKDKISIIALIFTLVSISISNKPLLLISVYLIHELGHVFFARLTGAKINKMSGGVFRLSISYGTEGLSYFKEALICSGGIIFNFISALSVSLANVANNDTLSHFCTLSAALAFMNMIPVSILDGGGILKALLLMKIRGDVAEKISFAVSFVFVIMMWLSSVYLQIIFASDVSLFLISVLLLIQLCFSI